MKKYLGFLGILRYFLYLCNMVTWEEYKRKNEENFKRMAFEKFGDKFDLSKVKYIKNKAPIIVSCPIHGDFLTTPQSFLKSKYGCSKCGAKAGGKIRGEKQRKTTDEFRRDAVKVHGNKYDYSKTDLENKREDGKVCIICSIHGEFWQNPNNHLMGDGCKECAKMSRSIIQLKKNEEFISEAREVHGDKYIYTISEYKGANKDIYIICPIHGKFKQPPHNHLRGHGCPKCNSSLLEKKVSEKLEENGITSLEHVRKSKLSWLERLTLDFYLPKQNIAIECQGGQHFKIIEHFGGKKELDKRMENDLKKKELCKENGTKLIYFLDEEYNKYMKEDDIYFNDVNSLIEYIKNVKS